MGLICYIICAALGYYFGFKHGSAAPIPATVGTSGAANAVDKGFIYYDHGLYVNSWPIFKVGETADKKGKSVTVADTFEIKYKDKTA